MGAKGLPMPQTKLKGKQNIQMHVRKKTSLVYVEGLFIYSFLMTTPKAKIWAILKPEGTLEAFMEQSKLF